MKTKCLVSKTIMFHLYFKDPKARTLSRLLFSKVISRKINKIIKNTDPDIIHAHSVQYGFISSNEIKKIPKVFTPMGSDIIVYAQKYFLYRYMAKKAFSCANVITGDSYLIQKSGYKIGARKEKNYIIQNGVDRSLFNERIKKGYLRKKFKLSQKTK